MRMFKYTRKYISCKDAKTLNGIEYSQARATQWVDSILTPRKVKKNVEQSEPLLRGFAALRDNKKMNYLLCASAPDSYRDLRDNKNQDKQREHLLCDFAALRDNKKMNYLLCASAPLRDNKNQDKKCEHLLCDFAALRDNKKQYEQHAAYYAPIWFKKILVFIVTIITLLLTHSSTQAQERYAAIEMNMLRLLPEIPGLDERVELSVNGVSLPEFLRGLGTSHSLNLSVDPSVTGNVTYNFTNAKVSDVLLFITRQYDLDIKFYGSIMSIYKYLPIVEKPKPILRKPKINYENQTDFLSLDLKNDSLDVVVEEITKKSMNNVILSPDVKGKAVSVYIQNRPFENALDKMAMANGLKITKTKDNFYYIEKEDATGSNDKNKRNDKGERLGDNTNNTNQPTQNLIVQKLDENVISVSAKNVPIAEIIGSVSKELLNNYFLYSEPKGNASLYIENASYDEFLSYLFNGTDYTYKFQDGVYLIGERKLEGLRVTELIQMKYRMVETVIENIPAQLKEGIEIKEFKDLNGIIVTASAPRMRELKDFLAQVDQVVPMVLCEVIIVDIKKSTIVSTGITAGLSNTPVQTGGTILSGVDMTLSSSSINSLISGINGFGSINLGFVTPDFYVKIKALEEDGYLKTRSTPQLATLNGHEANLTIGQTEYYLEVNNNVLNSGVNQNILQTQNYKSINADLSVKIKPFVSSDEQITLEIDVEQSDFTGKISTTAPPGTVKRQFKSMIRVKDGEMILLGGLEDQKKSDTSSGIPLLSRIPIIKWFFSNRTKEKNNDKLSIFIKTTVIY